MLFVLLNLLVPLLVGAPAVEVYRIETIAGGEAKGEDQRHAPPTATLDGITFIAMGPTGRELLLAGRSLQILDLRRRTLETIPHTDNGNWVGLAVDAGGNLYSFDEQNRLIKIQVSGESKVLEVLSDVASDLPSEMFAGGGGLAADDRGNVYVADHAASRIRKVSSDGTVTTLAGSGLTFKEAESLTKTCWALSYGEEPDKEQERLSNWPEPALRAEIRAVLEDCRKIDSELPRTEFGRLLSETVSRVTHKDGPADEARFFGVFDVTLDGEGNLLIAETWNRRVRKLTPGGEVSTVAGSAYGYHDGPAHEARFTFPRAVATDPQGNAYVVDSALVRKIDTNGWVTTITAALEPGFENQVESGVWHFHEPTDITIDGEGNLYVAENGNQALRKLTKVVH